MNEKLIEYLKEYGNAFCRLKWDDHLVRSTGPGHTAEVADLSDVHAGRETAMAYVLGKLINAISEEQGTAILKALETLQVREEESPLFGAFRWYREESGPKDTNAAFFILAPLAALRLNCPEKLGEREKTVLDSMLFHSYKWFSEECSEPILWYTNKIINDGAILAAIGKVTGNTEWQEEARLFLANWLSYTENRGYGWGENMSVTYNGVTLQGFALIKSALGNSDSDSEIQERLDRQEERILESFRFHNGYEFVPSIRTYNVEGRDRSDSILYNLAGVKGFGLKETISPEKTISYDYPAIQLVLYGDRLYLDENDYRSRNYQSEPQAGRFMVTRIMDDKSAYSWIGKNGGIGSINRFPVINGSYQHKTWGLGWQCMPVSLIVYGEQVSFLRFNVDDGVKMRHHPFKDKHTAYLDPALFGESHYPDVKTFCSQNRNTMIAIRSINKLRNKVRMISDSLDVKRFSGEIFDLEVNKRRWIVLGYRNAAICLTPLEGLPSSEFSAEKTGDTVNNRKTVSSADIHTSCELSIDRNGDDIRIVQRLYNGELTVLYDDRISSSWLFHFVDKPLDQNEAVEYLQDIIIEENRSVDGRMPRTESWYVHSVSVMQRDREILQALYDPYEN